MKIAAAYTQGKYTVEIIMAVIYFKINKFRFLTSDIKDKMLHEFILLNLQNIF